MDTSLKSKTINSFVWKISQQVCTLGSTFIIQLILARILLPSDFGIVAITTVFMTIANTFVETSFSSSVIQKKELTNEQLSSIFFANLVLSSFIYLILFFCAPLISNFYSTSILTPILRVQGIRIIFSSMYSIQRSLLYRRMEFKKIFFCYLTGAVCQGVFGIWMAFSNLGVWSLVFSTLINYTVAGVLMLITSKWLPKIYFSFKLIKDALNFSSKVLIVNVVEKIYANIRTLAIGKVYGEDTVGLFNKGFQFPSTIMTVVDGSLITVSFTSLSKLQTSYDMVRDSMRLFIRIISFFTTPILCGMFLVAKPMVIVLLTDKWINCVPFLQLICISQLVKPLLVKMQAFNAIGRSDISMKLNLSSIVISIILIFVTMFYSPLIMVASDILANIFLHITTAVVSKKVFDYSYKDQLTDFFTPIIPVTIMIIGVSLFSLLDINILLMLILQMFIGVVLYFGTSFILKNKTFSLIIKICKDRINKRKGVEKI